MVAQYLEKVGYFPVDLIGCPYNPAPIVQRYTKGAGEKVDQVRKVGRKIVVEVFSPDEFSSEIIKCDQFIFVTAHIFSFSRGALISEISFTVAIGYSWIGPLPLKPFPRRVELTAIISI